MSPFHHNPKAIPNNVTLSNSELAAGGGGKADPGGLGGPSRGMIDLTSVVDTVAEASFV